MPSVQDFLAEFRKTGFAKTEKYSVEIFPPDVVTDVSTQRTLRLYCEEASFPGLNVVTSVARIHNLDIQRPVAIDYQAESAYFTFFVDSEWKVKRFFDNWMSKIINTSREVEPYENIIGNITINAVHEGTINGAPTASDGNVEADVVRYAVKLHDAYPKNMDMMAMSYSNIGVHRLRVGFAFKYWTVEPVATGVGYNPREVA